MRQPVFRWSGLACLVLALTACERYVQFLHSLPHTPAAQEQDNSGHAWGTLAPATAPGKAAIADDWRDQELERIDFRILTGRARILHREYVLASAPEPRPLITALGNQVYRLEMVFRRDSRSSLRGNSTVAALFYYDGTELVFFRDTNHNRQFDRHDRVSSRHLIASKRGPPREVEFETTNRERGTLVIVFDRRRY